MLYIPISEDRPRVEIRTRYYKPLVLNNSFHLFKFVSVKAPICDPGIKLFERPLVLVFEAFEKVVELDAVDDFFSVAEGLVSQHFRCRGSRSFCSTL